MDQIFNFDHLTKLTWQTFLWWGSWGAAGGFFKSLIDNRGDIIGGTIFRDRNGCWHISLGECLYTILCGIIVGVLVDHAPMTCLLAGAVGPTLLDSLLNRKPRLAEETAPPTISKLLDVKLGKKKCAPEDEGR